MEMREYIIYGAAIVSIVILAYRLLKLKKTDSVEFQILREIIVEMDARDPYFNGHIKSIENMSMLLAENMKFSKNRKKDFKLAIYLTEIGKIRIPEYIITKREKLTQEEMSIVKKHPIVASKMVENIRGMEKIAEIVKAHHERYDGEGYPNNLLGDTIPLESRIINIVDSYIAMTSQRPYKKPLSEKEAIEELVKGKGKQFDSEIVDKFIEILKSEYKARLGGGDSEEVFS